MTALYAKKYGYDMLIINYRGTAGMKLTTPKFYNATDTDQIKECLEFVKMHYCGGGKRQFFAIGVSLGATILTNYMG